ncbi:hypothetical protein [Leeuwenhoekiella sp. ZYFB001]|uniref:hypothetical protein n=1 Tax=Leeuwenhoekiella sp. ZYFB001 TaxID=2719912 RepID=UPI001430EA26|nr:hypothetical protein [Leeuwenhoekiella sp. ZYFB001]
MERDSKGNIYTEIKNIRLTYVKSANRAPDKDWPGSDVIRIQAYRDGTSKSLHRGAEIPVDKKEDVIDIVSELLKIHKAL